MGCAVSSDNNDDNDNEEARSTSGVTVAFDERGKPPKPLQQHISTMRYLSLLTQLSGKTRVRPGGIERTPSGDHDSDLPLGLMLRRLDSYLLEELQVGSIALIDADEIRDWDPEMPLPRRQQLPSRMLLPPAQACALLHGGEREIGVLTYCWKTIPSPDPDGEALRAVQRFLTQDPRGRRIKAVFWDWLSLHQRDERSGTRAPDESLLFQRAISRMGDLYASAMGTVVMQFKGRREWVEAAPSEKTAAFRQRGTYNKRCWTLFESAVATEITERAQFFDTESRAELEYVDSLCPKLVRLEEEWWPIEEEDGEEEEEEATAAMEKEGGRERARGAAEEMEVMAERNKRRIAKCRAAIHRASSHMPADKEMVQRLYSAYVATISNAFCGSRCQAAGCTRYEFAEEGGGSAQDGYGHAFYPTGDEYEGDWLDGKHDGNGVYTWAEGDVYEGEWASGMKHGLGQCFYADRTDGEGDKLVTVYNENRRVGEGIIWVQGRLPHKMVDGEIMEELLVGGDEQARILAALGLPADHTPQKRGPRPAGGTGEGRNTS